MTDTGKLTTHVLDNATGRPAAGMGIKLFKLDGEKSELLKSVTTNADGRCDEPLLQGEAFATAIYELEFDVGEYYKELIVSSNNPGFLNNLGFLGIVPVRFGIGDQNSHYHVPLLVSPFAYSTYRGS